MRLRLICACCAISFVLLSGGDCLAQASQPATDTAEGGPELTYHGAMVTPPFPKPKFTLTDTSGQPFDFRAKTDGYVTLLFFGFTHCASVCPTQMAYLAGAMKKMPKDVTDRIKVVFVTTDPTHDNPRSLRTWLNNFNQNFVGLTGTEAEIEAAQKAANVPWSGSAEQHAAFVLAYTKDNLGHMLYPAGVTQADWLHDLPRLATETWARR